VVGFYDLVVSLLLLRRAFPGVEVETFSFHLFKFFLDTFFINVWVALFTGVDVLTDLCGGL
jgi:hypothetical protein